MENALKAVPILRAEFPHIKGIRIGTALGYSTSSIFLGDCAEGGTIDEISACNYYGFIDDPKENIWVMGVHKNLARKLKELGYYAECQDPGTYIAYPI